MRQQLMIARQRGFSLVELMVALTLSLVLMAGALSILYSSKVTNVENERLGRLQEAGRTVIELMLRDARAAGYPGCSRPVFGDEFANGLNSSASLLWNFGVPLGGFEASGGAWLPALDAALISSAITDSDVLVLRTTRQGQPTFRTTKAVVNVDDALEVDGTTTSLPANTPMIIADCAGAAVFMATALNAGSPMTIAHAAGNPGNTTGSLARGGFGIGSLVMPVQTVIYYVRNSAIAGVGPALWQKVGNADPQELVQGVENMQVLYGVDTDGDLLANDYRVASLVTDWRQVISLSVALLIRSPDEAGLEKDNRSYKLLDKTFGPFNDRRQRSVFTTTVVLRNRTS